MIRLNKCTFHNKVFPVFPRCHSFTSLKNAVEIGHVVKPALKGNFGNTLLRIKQHSGYLPQPEVIQILNERFTGFFF